ncbi:MAG: Cof-type HAD-IIB family hydrolase [Thermoguttaceae bacterium]|jgi:Cof subfamily protein (haloacid dehalogenase superfamily)
MTTMPARSTIYRLLAIDIDGTLVNSRDELTPDTQEALIRAGRAGIQVVLATGRRYSRTLHLVEPLGIDVPLITASGALVKDPKDHRTLHKTTFDPQLLRQILKLIDQGGYDPLLCADTFAEGFDFYLVRTKVKTPELQEYLDLNPNDGRIWPNMISDPPPDVFLVFTMGTKDQMLIMEQILHGTLSGRISTHVLRSPRYRGFLVEIAPAGVSKWSGVKRLAESLGIEQASICAVGDDVNDIPMIRAAGLGVAMGNALPEVKAAADRVAPTHDENGLVQVVEWLLE